jgi:DNA modification methylase
VSVDIRIGDALTVLRTLPSDSVHCCVTSPPYWGLRDYGTAKWEGGEPMCEHKGRVKPRQDTRGSGVAHGQFADTRGNQPGKSAYAVPIKDICKCGAVRIDAQLGLEKTPAEYVTRIVDVFEEVRRVLRPDGTLWLNIGDSYATGAGAVGSHPGARRQGARWKGERDDSKGRGTPKRADGSGGHQYMGPMTQPNRMPQEGLKAKDLVGIPWMLAFALRAAGWWLRSDIIEEVEFYCPCGCGYVLEERIWRWAQDRDLIWKKTNPMPESTKDRPTKAHEYIFLLTKSEKYYYDGAAIAEQSSEKTHPRRAGNTKWPAGWAKGSEPHGSVEFSAQIGRSPNSKRKLALPGQGVKNNSSFDEAMAVMPPTRNKRSVWTVSTAPFPEAHFATFPPALIEPCILAGSPRDGLVLDPFNGAGTTGLVCSRLGRNYIGIELKPEYAEMSKRRIREDAPLFHDPEAA